jgi:putative endonuclease
MRAKDAVGRYGEDIAARYLTRAGFSIIERNWRCELGEIDIVARDRTTVVICEVKTRRGLEFGSPLEAVTGRKLARLRRLAGRWLREHDVPSDDVRIDVIGIVHPRDGATVIEHLEGVA